MSNAWSHLPTAGKVDAAIERVKKIQWFKPMETPPKKAKNLVKLACKLFGVKASVEYRKLEKISDWSAAQNAAWDAAWKAARKAARKATQNEAQDAAWSATQNAAWKAAWDAAWEAARKATQEAARDATQDAAWSAAWEIVSDIEALKEKYPQNPFAVLLSLWEMGFYVCGVVDEKFILYYVPKK